MQDGPFRHQTLESKRLRTQSRVGLVVFWMLFIVAVILIATDSNFDWWVAGLTVGWAAATMTRLLIDAHYFIKGS